MAEQTPEDDNLTSLDQRRAEERRAVEEAGGGQAEGFEAAEELLIEHASHGDEAGTRRIIEDASDVPEETQEIAGEADEADLPDS